ncbi:MAG: hypothetical protein ACRD3S_04630 [Terracidiphilus sp.]
MRKKCKHITVSVTEEQYHRTRLLAAEFDTTVTSLVAYLLDRLPDALRRARYPKSQPAASPLPTEIKQKTY